MACTQGSQSRLAYDADATFDANSVRTSFLYEDLKKQGRIVGGRAITGTRSENVEATRIGSYKITGPIAHQPDPVFLDFILPRILGTAESTDTFDLAETLISCSILLDRVGSIFRYDTCYVNRAIFRAVAGPGDSDQELLEMVCDFAATTETDGASWAGTIPAIGTGATAAPYVLADSTLTVDGSAYNFKKFAIVIDNILGHRWVNSLTPTEICPQGRRVMLITENPFTAAQYTAFYANANAAGGLTGDLDFVNGNMNLKFAFSGLQWADQSPTVKGKREIPLYLTFFARKKGSTAELIVTNDSTA